MHDAVAALIAQDRPVEAPQWHSFWDRLGDGALRRGESVALLASLSTQMPGRATLTALLDSLAERRPEQRTGRPEFDGAVNIVGTGGGPSTLNISTAAALTAAAMGTRVVKTGSRAYTSRLGSLDLLERLGIETTSTYEQTHDMLERCGIAFAGPFVYPAELGLLARSVLPLDIRRLGRFVNAVGPFLADMPVAAQLTGISDPRLVAGLRHAAEHTARRTGRSVWLATNDTGADELIGFTTNLVRTYEGGGEDEFTLAGAALGLRPGTVSDLRPGDDPVKDVLDLLAGRGRPAAEDAVCLNAAALAVAGRLTGDWHQALRGARAVLTDGSALALVDRLRRATEVAHA
ncbi:anthranilate phosphoribosyltransferase [Streptomyces sp. NPDC096176]|uniref:anthranilate phosphoribosyltransferase n=1 Tax=Streptomyces sp. NPDC096176 TaxID=3366079 RepID=UPI00380FFBD8